MNYFKSKETGSVSAYSDEQLSQVDRLNELEVILPEIEPAFLQASSNYQQVSLDLSSAQSLLDSAIRENEGDGDGATREEINTLTLLVNDKAEAFNNAQDELSAIEAEYQLLKDEFDAILPAFFDIRKHLKTVKKMTPKEVDTHLNPPISKEQLISQAEMQKRILMTEAGEKISVLQDSVDLSMATQEEEALLKEWKIYRVMLSRVDISPGAAVVWPTPPASPAR